jgi:hypothetical protein
MSIVPAVWAISGLPAHPLLVHGATVLVMLAAIAAIVLMLWNAAWRRKFAGPLAVISLALLVLTQLTVITGEQLVDYTGEEEEMHDHAEAGEMTRNLLILMTLGLAAVAFVDRKEGAAAAAAGVRAGSGAATSDRRSLLSSALRLGTGVVALATVGYDIKAGHSGAYAVWHEELAGGASESDEAGESEGAGEAGEGAEATKEGGS